MVKWNLSAGDVIILCDQAVEDWLKTRLKRSPWSDETVTALLLDAAQHDLITSEEGISLQEFHQRRKNATQADAISNAAVERTLEFCIKLIEKHW